MPLSSPPHTCRTDKLRVLLCLHIQLAVLPLEPQEDAIRVALSEEFHGFGDVVEVDLL